MLYNVLDSSENIIGHVEADNPVDAWAKAREIYEATGSMVFDVRLAEKTTEPQTGSIMIELSRPEWHTVLEALRHARAAFTGPEYYKEGYIVSSIISKIEMQGNL